MDKQKLAVCAIVTNAARLLPEWLAHHHRVGVEHFVLYDNGSTDGSAQAVHRSPVAAHATVIHWPQQPGRIAAYRHFIDIFASGFEWAAFIDADQFLVPLAGGSVMDALDWQSNAAAVLVHRRVFGPGPWPAAQLAIETYDRRAADDSPFHHHVRTIARCSDLLDVTPHPRELRINGPVFDTAGKLVPNRGVQNPPCFQHLVINQYCADRPVDSLASLLDEAADPALPVDASVLAALSAQKDAVMPPFAAAVRALLGPGQENAVTNEPAVVQKLAAATQDAAPLPDAPPGVAQINVAPGWVAAPSDGQVRAGGLALVFRDLSRPGEHWLAALRGAAAGGIDPAFLMDEFERIRDFPSDAAARKACDAALAGELPD